MATTPNAAITTGQTATTSTISITANSAATLAAANSAIKQATGNAPPNTFAVGSTTNVSQATPGGKFTQGSVTTPALNARVSASPPPTNSGVSSALSVQSLLGIAALAGAGLTVFNKISGGINLFQSTVNNSNAVTPTSSTNNVQDPAETARLARQNAAITPSTGSTNNVQDPAQRAQAAAAIPSTGSTNNVSDPAQRAQAAAAAAPAAVTSTTSELSDEETAKLFPSEEDPFAAAESTTLSDAETSQLFAVDEDPFPNSETTVLSDEETANLFAQVDEETIESPFPEEIPDDATGVDEAVAQQQFEDSFVDDATGVDEAIAYQKDLEDGSLEFAGIDEQIANNENGLQEPPLLTDEEINQQLEDTIAEQQFEDSFVDDATGVDEAVAEQQFEDSFVDDATGVDEAVAEQKFEDSFVDDATGVDEAVADNEAATGATGQGLSTALTNTRTGATAQDEANFKQKEDWRVRLSLAPESNYLYNVPGSQGILAPLAATDGIIFPYTPAISIGYNASYDAADITHSNYKIYQYKNSSVDSISISCDFTAQDTFEANYLLAVIHFLRTVTKMFYGQDQDPKPGTPPPLCYLSGLGAFQFDAHPLAIQTFTYSLPTDVDYIRAGTTTTTAGVNKGASQSKVNTNVQSNGRTADSIGPGGTVPPPRFTNVPGGTIEPTYVPTKMQIQITAIPIVTRNDISNNFSVRDYATGALLRGMKGNKRISGGIW